MPETSVYSLWLQPSGDIAYQLQERIKKLSNAYDTPLFAPHVTLLGGLNVSETEVISLTDTLASSLAPFELTLTRAGYTDNFYQSLFIHIKKEEPLMEVRHMACQLFDIPEAERSYMPHLSLMYGELDRDEKERILNKTDREYYKSFGVEGIVLMRTEGLPVNWKRMHTSAFKL